MSTINRLLLQCKNIILHEQFCVRSALPVVTSVRWRKPRWVPKAKSKLYRVRVPTPIDPVENAELKDLYNNYKRHVSAIRKFTKDYLIKTKPEPVDTKKVMREEINDMRELNKKWNNHVAAERVQKQAAVAERLDNIKRLVEKRQRDEQKSRVREAALRIDFEKEIPFISLEDLDTEINKALTEKERDYNFALGFEGEIITKDSVKKLPDTDSNKKIGYRKS